MWLQVFPRAIKVVSKYTSRRTSPDILMEILLASEFAMIGLSSVVPPVIPPSDAALSPVARAVDDTRLVRAIPPHDAIFATGDISQLVWHDISSTTAKSITSDRRGKTVRKGFEVLRLLIWRAIGESPDVRYSDKCTAISNDPQPPQRIVNQTTA